MKNNKNMKIAIEAHALSQDNLTGVGKVILHYITELQKIDKENEYFVYAMDNLKHVSFDNPAWSNMEFSYALKNIRIKTRNKWLQLKNSNNSGPVKKIFLVYYRIMKILLETIDEIVFSFKLAKSLKKKNVDIYIGTSTYYFPYFFFSKIKKVGILYDLVWKFYPETMEFGNRIRMKFFTLRNMKKTDLLISISENTKIDAEKHLGIKTKIAAIPLAADSSLFYKADNSQVNKIKKKYKITKKYILSVSTLEPRKNFEALLLAFSKLKNYKNYQLVLTGMTGWLQSNFFQWIDNTDIRDYLIFTGYVPDEDLAPLYSGADLFAFPSLYEGFGLPVLEAMQCGTPVVTSDSSSIPEVIGDAGIMIDAQNIDSIIQGIESTLDNNDLLKKLSSRGLERSKQFSWTKSAEEFLRCLSEL